MYFFIYQLYSSSTQHVLVPLLEEDRRRRRGGGRCTSSRVPGGTAVRKYINIGTAYKYHFYGHITRFFLTADSFTSQFEILNQKPDFVLLHVMLNVRVAEIKWIGNIA